VPSALLVRVHQIRNVLKEVLVQNVRVLQDLTVQHAEVLLVQIVLFAQVLRDRSVPTVQSVLLIPIVLHVEKEEVKVEEVVQDQPEADVQTVKVEGTKVASTQTVLSASQQSVQNVLQRRRAIQADTTAVKTRWDFVRKERKLQRNLFVTKMLQSLIARTRVSV
jgi:hypothetical protein